MTVFTGESGYVELRRTHGSERPGVGTAITSSDVSPEARRFSVNSNEPSTGYFLATGDRVEIRLGDPLYQSASQSVDQPWLVKNHINAAGKYYVDWTGYIHVDAMGGIRLFNSYAQALEGKFEQALELEYNKPPQSSNPKYQGNGTSLRITQINTSYRCLSQVKAYEFTTERETVDVTRLGDAFRKQYEAGLITGQGSLNCLWDYQVEMCTSTPDAEFSYYLSQLCLRIHTGAMFTGRFVLHADGINSVFYEAACIVTNSSITVEPTELISSDIQFVTTDVIQLRIGQVPGELLQEGGDLVLDEDDDPVWLDD